MYLANKDLRKDYLKYLQISRKAGLLDYIIQNNLESAAFFYSVMNKADVNNNVFLEKAFKVIKSSCYHVQYIKYVKDNPCSREIINSYGTLEEKVQLAVFDKKTDSTLEQEIIASKNYKLLFDCVSKNLIACKKQVSAALLKSNKAKYIFAGAKISKKNLQSFVDKLISRHKKTYIFAMMKKYPNLDYSKYENYLIKNNLVKEMKTYLSLKSSEKLENYLLL